MICITVDSFVSCDGTAYPSRGYLPIWYSDYYRNRFVEPDNQNAADKLYYCEEIKVVLGCWELSSDRAREIEENYRKVC